MLTSANVKKVRTALLVVGVVLSIVEATLKSRESKALTFRR